MLGDKAAAKDHQQTEKTAENAQQRMEGERQPEKIPYRDVPAHRVLEEQCKTKIHGDAAENRLAERQKAAAAEKMVVRDFPVSPDKKRDQSDDLHMLDKDAFGDELKKRNPESTKDEIERTAGFYDSRDQQAFVKDAGNTLNTSIHEKLHQKSESRLPTSLNEGMTEYLSKDEAGAVGQLRDIDSRGRETKKPEYYREEAAVVAQLDAVVGRNTLHEAYFHGRDDVLKDRVDEALGQGAFAEIMQAMKEENAGKARDIIHSRWQETLKKIGGH